MQKLVHKLTVYLLIVALALVGAAVFALSVLVKTLPAEPSPALVGLLSGLTTGIVGALGVLVGALAGAYMSIAGSRSSERLSIETEDPDRKPI